MSTTEQFDVNLARMIARLRTYRSGGHWGHYNRITGRYGYSPGKQVWTDEQIMESLGLTKKRFDELVEYHRTQIPPRYFTEEEWKQRYFKFWDKNKRWHTRKDERNWRETGLHGNGHWRAATDWMEHYCSIREGRLRKYPEMVFTIPNLTVRRNVIDRLGGSDALVRSLVEQGKAEKIQQDDFGTLWRLNFSDGQDSHMRYVEVINSTPNEDGEYDHYFLRVPPGTTSAKNGVAWTFDKNPRGFKFAAQS